MFIHYRNVQRNGKTSVGWTLVWNSYEYWLARTTDAADRERNSNDESDIVHVDSISEREYRVEKGYAYPDGNPTKRSRHENR